MKKDLTLTQEDFDGLLGWLAADREEAGRRYEAIRGRLIRFFSFRGCYDPPMLADETINRVALKISELDNSKNVKTITYFYSFASYVHLEYVRNVKSRDVEFKPETFLPAKKKGFFADTPKTELDCLENCLMKLPAEEGKLVVYYYSKDKSEKFVLRKRLADTMKIQPTALYARVYRIKTVLRDCIENCLNKNSL